MANSGVFWQIRGVPFFHNDRDGAVDHQDFFVACSLLGLAYSTLSARRGSVAEARRAGR